MTGQTDGVSVNIDVLMPAFNPGSYGTVAVLSVLDQLRNGDRLIIQDGLSTDGWEEHLPDSAQIFFRSEADDGQADALNRALQVAKAPLVCWLNADDILYPGALQAIRDAMSSNVEALVAYGDYTTIDGNGELIRRFRVPYITYRDLISKGCLAYSGSFAVSRELLFEVGGFSTDFHFCMDYELFLRVWQAAEDRTVRVNALLGALRIHDGTKTTTRPWQFVREASRARRDHVSTNVLAAFSYLQTVSHALTVATTSIRASPMYRRVRHGVPNVT